MFFLTFCLAAFASIASYVVPKAPLLRPTAAGAFPLSNKTGHSSFTVQLKTDTSLGKRSYSEFHKRTINLNLS
jgi:hypothetical protein